MENQMQENYIRRGNNVIPLNLEGIESLLDKIEALSRENETLKAKLTVLQKEHEYYHAQLHDILGNF